MTAPVPRPAEEPDREALAQAGREALREAADVLDAGGFPGWVPRWLRDRANALLPTPPAPGGEDPDDCAKHKHSPSYGRTETCQKCGRYRFPAPGGEDGLRAENERLRTIQRAVMDCPDDARRELYRADLIAGQHIARAVIAEAEVERLAAALTARGDADRDRDTLAQVRALSEAARAGTWFATGQAIMADWTGAPRPVAIAGGSIHEGNDANAAFIAAAANYVRAALARDTAEAGEGQ
jgi:hypothetical protein